MSARKTLWTSKAWAIKLRDGTLKERTDTTPIMYPAREMAESYRRANRLGGKIIPIRIAVTERKEEAAGG